MTTLNTQPVIATLKSAGLDYHQLATRREPGFCKKTGLKVSKNRGCIVVEVLFQDQEGIALHNAGSLKTARLERLQKAFEVLKTIPGFKVTDSMIEKGYVLVQ